MTYGGVYEIRNRLNGRQYIGSTFLFAKRFKEHANALKRGNHHSLESSNGS